MSLRQWIYTINILSYLTFSKYLNVIKFTYVYIKKNCIIKYTYLYADYNTHYYNVTTYVFFFNNNKNKKYLY